MSGALLASWAAAFGTVDEVAAVASCLFPGLRNPPSSARQTAQASWAETHPSSPTLPPHSPHGLPLSALLPE